MARVRGEPPASPSHWPKAASRVFGEVRRQRLTYLAPKKLESLANLVLELERVAEPGIMVEAGCALGGSSILLCAVKAPSRPLYVHDVFGMIPAPTEKDGPDVHERYRIIASGGARGLGGGDEYYGYRSNLKASVERSFSELGFPIGTHSVSLVEGLVENTLTHARPVCLAHIDVDWYEPVMTCLERLVPLLTPRGAIVLDDYQDWSGCRRAVDEYFERNGRKLFEFDSSAGHLVVRRGRD